jgi:hypothetical protein
MRDGQLHASPEAWDIPPAAAFQAFVFEYRNVCEQKKRLDYLSSRPKTRTGISAKAGN